MKRYEKRVNLIYIVYMLGIGFSFMCVSCEKSSQLSWCNQHSEVNIPVFTVVFLFVCVSVCVCVCVCVCVYLGMSVCICMCKYVCLYVHLGVSVCQIQRDRNRETC